MFCVAAVVVVVIFQAKRHFILSNDDELLSISICFVIINLFRLKNSVQITKESLFSLFSSISLSGKTKKIKKTFAIIKKIYIFPLLIITINDLNWKFTRECETTNF